MPIRVVNKMVKMRQIGTNRHQKRQINTNDILGRKQKSVVTFSMLSFTEFVQERKGLNKDILPCLSATLIPF